MIQAPNKIMVPQGAGAIQIVTDEDFLQSATASPDQFLKYLKEKKSSSADEKTRIIVLVSTAAIKKLEPPSLSLSPTQSTASRRLFRKIVFLAHNLVRSNFEREYMDAYDAVVTAAVIVDLERSCTSKEAIFVDQSVTTTRALQYCPLKNQVAVIACPAIATIKAQGTFKKVVSSAILNLNAVKNQAKPGVFAHSESQYLATEDFANVRRGLLQMQRLTSTAGICSVESVVHEYAVAKDAQTASLVTIKAVFEGYQGDLKQIIRGEDLPSDLEKLIIMKDLVYGLIQTHKKNIINGDIKPRNALFCIDGTLEGAKGCLSDFDFAFSLENGGKPTMVLGWGYYGSIQYTDPQHYGKEEKGTSIKPIDYYKALDTWALGCVLLQLWKDLESLPWAGFLQETYEEDFKKNRTHKNLIHLVINQKKVIESIEKRIEKPLKKLLEKSEESCSFKEKVERVILSLLRNDPCLRIDLTRCAKELEILIEEGKKEEPKIKAQEEAQVITYKNQLKMALESDPNPLTTYHRRNSLRKLILNRDGQKACRPFDRETIKIVVEAATSIVNEQVDEKAQLFFRDILKHFVLFQSAHLEKYRLSIAHAWQLAAYCRLELRCDESDDTVQHISKEVSGLSNDIQFDPRSGRVTIVANVGMGAAP